MILFFLSTFFIQTIDANAHRGRTDASGCHNDYSNGTYHCHNGGSSSSSSHEYKYKDVDQNGINDYEQDRDEIAKNIQSKGLWEGYSDATSGEYDPTASYHDYTNAEHNWFKLGYEKGYTEMRIKVLELEANREGYQSGLKTDDKSVPSKYLEYESVQASYDKGFEKGQTEKWKKLAEETAMSYKIMNYPDTLAATVKETAEKKYKQIYEKELKNAYEMGYSSAFKDETIRIPKKIENAPAMIEQYKKGFHDNTEVLRYKEHAYKNGLKGKKYEVPSDVLENDAVDIYKKHYDKGKAKYWKTVFKWGSMVVLALVIVIISIFIYKKRKKYKTKQF